MRKAALFLACLLCFTHLAGCTATPVVSDLPADTTGVTSTTAEESPAGTAGSSTAYQRRPGASVDGRGLHPVFGEIKKPA